jgi:type IV pilus assembly protein PilM
MARWLDALPHPPLACEIAPDRVAAVRWTHTGSLGEFAVEPLPAGAVLASAVETNILNVPAVRAAVASVFDRLRAHDQDVTLLVPDPVIRVFVQHFDEFPRSAQEAEPMLRWKLKKSVPFEADETLVSYVRQAPKEHGVDVVTGLARLRIMREYEMLVEAAGLRPGVVMTSSLAAVSLLDDSRPALLARVCGTSLTTAIVREGVLCGYRCTDLPSDAAGLTPQMLLEEVYPIAAYYHDSWQDGIQSVCLGGLGDRAAEFLGPMQEELRCPVSSLLGSVQKAGRLREDAQPLADRELEGLVGWMHYRSVHDAEGTR